MTDGYDGFVRRAFVEPIRSALIVDDDYPTYDDVLSGHSSEVAKAKEWRAAPERVRGLLEQLRRRATPLLVDIHDGQDLSAQGTADVAGHLHQSDLLILDYELNRTKREDGTKAINILRRIASNGHFNLVIIYTSMQLATVFQQVRIGLLSSCPDLAARKAELENVAIEQLEGAEGNLEDAEQRFLDSVAIEAYLDYRLDPSLFLEKRRTGEQPLAEFYDLCREAMFDDKVGEDVLVYCLAQREQKLQASMNSRDLGALSWGNRDPQWIQTDSVFIALAHKGTHDHVMERLDRTLIAWSPPPSRLFLSRLRAEIDEEGFAAQESVLGRRRALAFWYERLLAADRELRLQFVADSMRGHADLLLDEVLPKVSDFASEMIELDQSTGKASSEISGTRFAVNLTETSEREIALIEHNALACSRPPGGRHLTTGHIFLKDGEHWICLSPTCDLVPNRGSQARRERFKDWLPFIAVRLHPAKQPKNKDAKKRQKEDITGGRYIFLYFREDGYKGFSFTERSNSQPVWEVVYAKERGVFRNTGTRERVMTTCWPKVSEEKLVSVDAEVEIVGQLRYEYALNLQSRLGVSLSRVGLDFVGTPV